MELAEGYMEPNGKNSNQLSNSRNLFCSGFTTPRHEELMSAVQITETENHKRGPEIVT